MDEQEKPHGDPAARRVEARQLAGIVAGEAYQRARYLAEFQPDPSLVNKGWEFRFVTDGSRVQEMTDLYRELGFEVRAEPLETVSLAEECEACQLTILLQFKAIYTRKAK